MDKLRIVPMELKDANAYIEANHRHHKRVQGHRFSLGCIDGEGVLRGVAVVGRPVARYVNLREVLEVTRLCTDGTKNACSCLYGASARVGKALGYKIIQTYILDEESGISLIASGWTNVGIFGGGNGNAEDAKIGVPINLRGKS
jgi:hypothetical protein